MDPAGAAALQARLEQQRHWLLATAVQDGSQPHADPDVQALKEIRGEERLYYDEREGTFAKRLVDGAWKRLTIGPGGLSGPDPATRR
jgi:hypothetical protein